MARNIEESDGYPTALLRPGMDRVLDSLRDRRRRLILLMMNDGTVRREADVMVRGSDPETIETELRRSHLPALDEAGYIEWDPDTGEISKGPRFDEIVPLLDLIENHADELPPGWP